MRTVFIGAHEDPNGVNSYTYNMALELSKRGFKSMVLAFGSCDKVSDYNGVEIRQYKCHGGTIASLPMLYLKSIPYLFRYRKEIDVVMYQTVTFSVIPALIARVFGLKTCSIVHSLPEDSPKHSVRIKKLMIASMKLAMIFTKNVITVSKTKETEIYDRYGKHCKVLPCGVFVPKERKLNTNILEKHGIIAGKYFLSIGRIDPIKNLDVLIDAFKRQDYGDYQLVICGDMGNDYGETIVGRAAGCKNIIFPGIVVGDAKAQLLKYAMAYCLVSSSEGLPIALLEGMVNCNVPVVSDIPSIKEVLGDFGIGLWSRVKNAEDLSASMNLIESEHESFREQGKVARKIVVENYTWQRTCDKYLEMVKTF